MSEKCPFHDDLKAEVDKQAGKVEESTTWQATFSEKIGAIGSAIERNTSLTDEVKRCITELNLSLAKEYVTKLELSNMLKQIETDIALIHTRLHDEKKERDENAKHRKEYSIRVLAAVFVGGGVLFAIIAWIVDTIRGLGVL